MSFEEVLDQAIDMLRRRGRLTYRTLKRQFDLDDDVLEDLTKELIYGQRLAADEDGRVLVWTGDIPGVTEPDFLPSPSVQSSKTHQEQPPRADASSASQMPDAERRQITVMFCDLVGSTPLSQQLDPEDLREVVRDYQQTCAEVVQRFDGHIAQLLGGALLVYFGWPQAHEDDAQRAVRTGLGMLDAMGTLNTRLEQEKGIRLAIRVGIHTGLVVVGEMGGGGHQEQLALGDTPNIASRLQGLAEPDTVLISDVVFRLIEGISPARRWAYSTQGGGDIAAGVSGVGGKYRADPFRDGDGPWSDAPGGPGRRDRFNAAALGASQGQRRSDGTAER
jgi:class 3 adenylate cyclase